MGEAKIKKKQDKISETVNNNKIGNSLIIEEASVSQMGDRKETNKDKAGTNMACDIKLENFDVSYGDKTLLQGADLQLIHGRRYGFCGRNGLGKTTLLRMLAGRHLRIPPHVTVLHVEQEVVGDDTTALQSVLECDTKRESLLQEEKTISSLLNNGDLSTQDSTMSERLSQIYKELEAIDADKAPAKAAIILNGLGFNHDMKKAATRTFSGGWRMRIALARALFSKPDLLLLDEPTNMLDMKAIIWLENYLLTWPTTILCVSHDRQFLNCIATDIIHLQSQLLATYRGDYDMFVKTREEKLKNQQREYEAQMEYRQHIQVFIDRFRYNANRASQVQSKLKLLEKLPELNPVEKETEAVLKFPDCDSLSPPILMLDELCFYYKKEKPIFKNVNISAQMDSRICIVGENGAGKTTLLKILLEDLKPISGVRHAHRNLRLGYFSQHHVDQLSLTKNCVEALAEKYPGQPVLFYRQQLGSFGVSGDLALKQISSLSGGQKSRVAFASMCITNPNFLILDEPTNHLDVETIDALGRAINKFKGGVMLVSHDERLIRMVCKELWVCQDQNIFALEGGIDEYKRIVEKEMEVIT